MVEVFRGADSVRFDRMVGGRNRFHTVPYARVRRRRKQVLDLRRRTATRFAFPPRNTPFPRGGADASDATPPFAGRQRVVPLSFIFPPFPRFFFLFFSFFFSNARRPTVSGYFPIRLLYSCIFLTFIEKFYRKVIIDAKVVKIGLLNRGD